MIKDFLESMANILVKTRRMNFRDRRGHYASGNLSCLRDQYWAMTGEPETNETDLVGALKMMCGDALESGIVSSMLSRMHLLGYHLLGTQVPVGGSNPNWNGYIDALMARRNTEGNWEKFVVEIKTKSGFGANFFYDKPAPSAEYMTQLGLYLKDMYEKQGVTQGMFVYLLLSDKYFGTLVTIDCQYDPESQIIRATKACTSDGKTYPLNVSQDIGQALKRWVKLDKALAAGQVPAGEYQYKRELTDAVLEELSDYKLKQLMEGTALIGDWQVLYSRYKNKQVEADGVTPERTPREKALAWQEYRRRHPRAKLTTFFKDEAQLAMVQAELDKLNQEVA